MIPVAQWGALTPFVVLEAPHYYLKVEVLKFSSVKFVLFNHSNKNSDGYFLAADSGNPVMRTFKRASSCRVSAGMSE